MGQIENMLSERAPGNLPSDTEKNTKETIKVVSLRSGTTLTDPVVKARPKVVNKYTETPPEKKSEEKKGQSTGVKKEIEESRHMLALPLPQKMKREKLDKCFGRFSEMLKQLYVNIPFTEILTQMPTYAKFLKEILSSKRKLEETIVDKLNAHSWSDQINTSVPQLADQTTILPEGIIEDILVRVDKFVFPVEFIVVDMEVNKKMKRMMKYPGDDAFTYSFFKLDVVGELTEKYKFDKLVEDTLERCITQSSTVDDEDPEIKKEDEAFEIEHQVVNQEELKEEASKPNVELKVLPTHLKYAFLETNNFSVIISANLTGTQELKLVELLKKHKKAIGWSIADIQGISPTICMHKILLEENNKPVVKPQRKLNKNLEEVVHKEIIKLLDAGVIFPIFDSQWISPVQVVPKKGGMTKGEK
ncbi:uncharacterized protein [Nicotiana sylvestris]|uniref:uncharacterized protein n=1 Tax=Nicotiana sylvestris TaxID=4096 RepID=UPI00388CE058